MRFLPAEQKHHPDKTGWTVTVLGSNGQLYARFFGASREQAERRAQEFREDVALATSER